jgi:hypothetical protein
VLFDRAVVSQEGVWQALLGAELRQHNQVPGSGFRGQVGEPLLLLLRLLRERRDEIRAFGNVERGPIAAKSSKSATTPSTSGLSLPRSASARTMAPTDAPRSTSASTIALPVFPVAPVTRTGPARCVMLFPTQ